MASWPVGRARTKGARDHTCVVGGSVNYVLHRIRLTDLMIRGMWTWLSVHQDPVLIDRWRVPRTWLLSQSKPFVR